MLRREPIRRRILSKDGPIAKHSLVKRERLRHSAEVRTNIQGTLDVTWCKYCSLSACEIGQRCRKRSYVWRLTALIRVAADTDPLREVIDNSVLQRAWVPEIARRNWQCKLDDEPLTERKDVIASKIGAIFGVGHKCLP